jgi:hypothetical protein
MTAAPPVAHAGLATALGALYAGLGPGVLPCGPGGHAVVPRELAVSADRVWCAGTVSARDWPAESVVPHGLAGAAGLVCLRIPVPAPACGGGELVAGLARLRLDLSRRLLDDCVDYLAGRSTGGAALLDQQLVRGDLADAGTAHEELSAVLDGTAPVDVLGWVHGRVTAVDRMLLRLLGASSFVADGPGGRHAVSELLADVYVGEVP